MELIEYPDAEVMALRLADRLASEISMGLRGEGTVSLAVPGGSSPGPVFDNLSGADLKWDRVKVFLTDERRVPPDHDRSNEKLIRTRLLTGKAAAAEFTRLVPDEETGIDALCDRLAEDLPLTIVLLGMGDDMHTASLFPGSPELEAALDKSAPPLMAMSSPEGLEPRISLTAPVFWGAMHTHLLIVGADKREALERARKSDPKDAPIAAFLGDATVHWAKE